MNRLLCSATTWMSIQPCRSISSARADVVDVAAAIGHVLLTVVIQADLRLVIAHIDEGNVESVADHDLRSRGG